MRCRLMIVLALAVIVTSWVCAAPYLGSYLILEKPLASADALLVLSGSAAYKERTQKAAELYKQGVAPRIFISDDGGRGGWSRTEERNPTFVELEQRELIASGVLPDAIKILPGRVSGTDSEAKALAAELEIVPLRSVVLVTSPYHTRRAFWIFDEMFANKGVEIGIEHSPLTSRYKDPATWWLSVRGWKDVGGEYVKLAAYWAYY